jgi:hypothetical protein
MTTTIANPSKFEQTYLQIVPWTVERGSHDRYLMIVTLSDSLTGALSGPAMYSVIQIG